MLHLRPEIEANSITVHSQVFESVVGCSKRLLTVHGGLFMHVCNQKSSIGVKEPDYCLKFNF